MKKLLLSVIILIAVTQLHAATTASVDSLQKQLGVAKNDSLKADIYTQLAKSYMGYAVLQDKDVRTVYQENAINSTLKALHHYYRMDDSTGMRICYDRLSRIYRDQHKYSQAKWFILQANTMARAQNDQLQIIESLITLADIKMDIKDYYLAKGDLIEALELSSVNHLSNQQSDVMLTYARYYNHVHKPAKAAAVLQRYTYMKDSMKLDSQARRMAKIQVKKKLYYTVNTRLLSKNKSTRLASL